MSRIGRKSGDGRRTITADEAKLWEHATRSLEPVKAKPRVVSVRSLSESPARETPHPARASATPAGSQPAAMSAPKPRAAAASKGAKVSPAPLADFERRKARQIASGKVEVDARVDLHGLRQRDAHARLCTFLVEAYARGHKTVLVITGKGGEKPTDRLGELAGERQRGVLRHNVPHWLAEPELRAIVLSVTQAGVRHGGAGALYVQLRRAARRS